MNEKGADKYREREREKYIGFWQSFVFFFFSCYCLDYMHTLTQKPKNHIFSRKVVKIYVMTFVGSTKTCKKSTTHNTCEKKRKAPSLLTFCTLFLFSLSIFLSLCLSVFTNQMKINTTFSVVLFCHTFFFSYFES